MIEILAKQQQKQGIRWLMGSGAIAGISVLSLLGYTWIAQRPPAPIKVTTRAIELGSVEQTINESGILELANQQILKAPDDSTVEEVLVTVGQPVQAGQEIIRLRNPERETRLQQQLSTIEETMVQLAHHQQKVQTAQKNLETAQGQLQIHALELEQKQLQLERYQQRVQEKQADLEDTQEELKNLQELADKGFIAGDRLRSQRQAVRNAEIAVRDAQHQVETETLSLDQQKLAKSNELQTNIANATSEMQSSQLTVNTTQLQLQRQELELRKIEQELQDTLIKAPINGVILGVNVSNGEGVTRGHDLLTLGNPSQEYVRLSLSILNAPKVRLNQPARITIIGPDAPIYEGQVVALSPQAISVSDSEGVGRGLATVSAVVQLNQPTGTLIPGSQVNVEIILDQRQDVVVISLESLQKSGKNSFVWVKDQQGLAQKREVTLGLEGLETVEVLSGLEPGDQVILPTPDQNLEPGMALETQSS
ncbi:efflux RND transporter periplasmic adaptor subunit [Roseofilum sp. BLCC_M154]|uniref:Efflux RND transporter periplasmic adaptor subunit n=1 Tax=Roseofilum acuticapitatum BLCC-M154 TaxID=3022444 RepID=A0ABT7ARL0_9CYAN|nr:efflux RND transporter periplasmic adaptor subunit [Roseofilum acuticapitatum]MDJ1169543.1 efflux RND transporter periplasmic adaptor subunit [Roseofilum acuticapitatum BLCC-M154]